MHMYITKFEYLMIVIGLIIERLIFVHFSEWNGSVYSGDYLNASDILNGRLIKSKLLIKVIQINLKPLVQI